MFMSESANGQKRVQRQIGHGVRESIKSAEARLRVQGL